MTTEILQETAGYNIQAQDDQRLVLVFCKRWCF